MFQDSFAKIFETDENNEMPIAFSGKITVKMSKYLKVNGAIGPCRSLNTGGP
jgi:protein transport protein SEC23